MLARQPMKVVIPGGSGQVGAILARALRARGDDVVIVSRGGDTGCGRVVEWDGRTLGPWPRRSTAPTRSSIWPAEA